MRVTNFIKTAAASILGVAVFGTSVVIGAETKGPVTDDIAVIKLAKGEPIQIGFYGTLSGPDTALGLDQLRGVEVLVDDFGGELVGHRIKLQAEDAVCTAEGGQTAATKLAANQKIVAVAGASCSSATTPGAPILWKSGIPSVGISPTAPILTAPDRDQGYNGFVRTIWNDVWAGEQTAAWAYNEMGARTTSGIHDGSPYAEGLVQAYLDSFAKLGGTVVGKEAVSPTDTDLRPMLTKVATSKPDIIFYPDFVQVIAHITRQSQEIDGLQDTILLTADGALVPDVIEMTGEAILNLFLTSNDLSPAAMGEGYPAFVKKYEAKYGEKPIHGFHHFGYDAAHVIFKAIEKVAVHDDAGNTYIGRKAVRDAIFATKGHEGLSGDKTCNEYGDCGTFNYTVYRYVSTTVPYELNVNPKKVYPAN